MPRRHALLQPLRALRLSVAFLPVLLLAPATAPAQGVLVGEISGDQFGAAVQGVGDLNGDGYEDFAVGAPGNDRNGSEAGTVFVFLGRPENIAAEPDRILTAGNGGDHFGAAVAGIGRFNNDIYDDLAVGAPDSDAGGSGRGRVYIYYGGPTIPTTPSLTLSGIQGGDHFGWSVGGRFDYDDDGYDDLAVGAPDRPTAGLQGGEVRIFRGGSPPATTAAVILAADQAQDWFGAAVSGAGDVDDDGFGDLVVGAPQPFAANSGKAYVYFGRGDGQPLSRLELSGENGTDRFGWSVSAGGDLDGDGFADVAIGAPRQDAGASNNGAVYVYRGGDPMNADFDAKLGGRSSGDELGTSVSIQGDHDGDGRADLLAGAPLSDADGARAGELNQWRGGTPVNLGSRQVVTVARPAPTFAAEDRLGSAVGFADYNGDGFDEILGGAPEGNKPGGDAAGFASLNFSPGTLVPVRVLDMTIRPGGDRARLEWRADDDGDLVGFHVERRSGKTEWLRVSRAAVTGRSGRFHFDDADPDLLAGGLFEYSLVALMRNGLTDRFGPWSLAMAPSLKPQLGLGYPNPTDAGVTIPVVMPESASATVRIFDTAGREVRRLFSGSLTAGKTTLWWDGRDDSGTRLPAGNYYYRLETQRTVTSRKVVILR